MIIPSLLYLTTLCVQIVAPMASPPTPSAPALPNAPGQIINGVRTTAYTHTEADHVEYGPRSAVGTLLKHDELHSAAADWSIYPLGTIFQIKGDKSLYVVDDYGSALVGTRTIDIYQPTRTAMNRYGTRRVSIRIISWGSRTKSLAILKPRAGKAEHVRKMITRLRTKPAA